MLIHGESRRSKTGHYVVLTHKDEQMTVFDGVNGIFDNWPDYLERSGVVVVTSSRSIDQKQIKIRPSKHGLYWKLVSIALVAIGVVGFFLTFNKKIERNYQI